ncbi:MAG: hypothetical protein ABID61_01605 [Candidatus Micrarchaeota archaeon]
MGQLLVNNATTAPSAVVAGEILFFTSYLYNKTVIFRAIRMLIIPIRRTRPVSTNGFMLSVPSTIISDVIEKTAKVITNKIKKIALYFVLERIVSMI